MLSTVMVSTAADPEVWIRLVTSRNSRIQVMLDQEDDPDLDNEWLTDDERLTSFSKARTGSISPQYHVVFDDMFSTVVISTATYPEVWIRLVTSRNSRIQFMLDQ